jgi:hypothetical protein
MVNLIVLISSLVLASPQVVGQDFTSSNINREFCKDIASNLKEVGVTVSYKSMTRCSLQVFGGAVATFDRSNGNPVNVIVKSNPYRMFITRGDNDIGTCYVLHPKKVRRKVKGRDC